MDTKKQLIVKDDDQEEISYFYCTSFKVHLLMWTCLCIVVVVFITIIGLYANFSETAIDTNYIKYDVESEQKQKTINEQLKGLEDSILNNYIFKDNLFENNIESLESLRKKREISTGSDRDEKKSFFKMITEDNKNKCQLSKLEKRNIDNKFRIKRNAYNLYDSRRDKRFASAQQELEYLQQQYFRCNRDTNNGNQCDDIYLKFEKLAKEVNEKLAKFSNDINQRSGKRTYFQNEESHMKIAPETITNNNNEVLVIPTTLPTAPIRTYVPREESHFTTTIKQQPIIPTTCEPDDTSTFAPYIHQINNLPLIPFNQPPQAHKVHDHDNLGKPFFGDEFYYTYEAAPKVHEDLFETSYNHYKNRYFNQNEHYEEKSKSQQFSQYNNMPNDVKLKATDKHDNTNKNTIQAPSGPFMILCDQLSRQNGNEQSSGQNPQPPTGFAYYNGPQFQTIQQFANGQKQSNNIPITGETTSSSSQIILNPGYSFSPSPICFYPSQSTVHQQKIQQPIWTITQAQLVTAIEPRLAEKATIGQFVQSPTTSSGSSTRSQHENQQLPATQPVYCTYLPPNKPEPIKSETSNSKNRNKISASGNEEEEPKYNIPTDSDIIYASYSNQLVAFTNRTIANMQNFCPFGYFSCFSINQCIEQNKWCDSVVDCLDSSDETACSCKSRLDKSKICDGHIDCPMGSDEIGCFGCDKFSYSCYSNIEEFHNNKKSSLSMCYTIIDKCDGIANCRNGKDEKDCSMIVRTIGQHLSYMVSYTEGFLHRNYKGRWYPVCDNPLKWAREACEAEIGSIDFDPTLSFKSGFLPGQFIQPAQNDDSGILEPFLSESCPSSPNKNNKNVILYVKCPPPQCGITQQSNYESTNIRVKKSHENTTKSPILGDGRIVGGEPCDPMRWPFIVGMYRDGSFHCGGIIHNELWIITAAHCVSNYKNHYFEIRAGIIRRYSYAPSSQIVKVAFIVDHENYDRIDMKNDLALLKLESPLIFNRWVKPICLPGPGRTSFDKDWIYGPIAGTLCKTVGWGAIREKGPDPDQLREVSVPILPNCKHLQDREGQEICAGDKEGGRDACQGDSGGPLFCNSVANPSEWYLAGIVSHGEGCARPDEPGVYTRVALYIDWILAMESNPSALRKEPLKECPGHRCVWGGGLCIPKRKRCNGIVDCLGGEDEINCAFTTGDDGSILGSNATTDDVTDQISNIATTVLPVQDETTKTPLKELPAQTTAKPMFAETTTLQPIISPTETNTFDKNTLNPINSVDENNINDAGKVKRGKNITLIEGPRFLCRRIKQTINFENRCDTIADCEDGTDEEGCLCRDYLLKDNPDRICDGKVDCFDLSDEADCLICLPNEYACLISKRCIPKRLQCDGEFDCKFREDELDCYALTDGFTVFLDPNLRPILKFRGLVSQNTKGAWNLFCSDEKLKIKEAPIIAAKVCSILGFGGFTFFNITKTAPRKLRTELFKSIVDRDIFVAEEDPTAINEVKNDEDETRLLVKCYALFVECVPHLNWNFTTIQLPTLPQIPAAPSLPQTIQTVVQPLVPPVIPERLPVTNTNIPTEIIVDNIPILNPIDRPIARPTVEVIVNNNPNAPPSLDPLIAPIVNPPETPTVLVDVIQPVAPIAPVIIEVVEPVSPIVNPSAVLVEPFAPIINPAVIVEPNVAPEFIYIEPVKHKSIVEVDDIHWPWSASIFVGGKLVCIGIIIDKYWVITESSCLKLVRLDYDYVVVVIGTSKPTLSTRGPVEQVIRVNCIVKVDRSNTVLLYLEYPAHFNRDCLPTYLPEIVEKNSLEQCFAISHDINGNMNAVAVVESNVNCTGGFRCFVNIDRNVNVDSNNQTHNSESTSNNNTTLSEGGPNNNSTSALQNQTIVNELHNNVEPYNYYDQWYRNKKQANTDSSSNTTQTHAKHCDGQDQTRCGSIVCKSKSSSYFPIAFYSHRHGLCSFEQTYSVLSLERFYADIQYSLDVPRCDNYYKAPICYGHRCLLGACIRDEQVCDGKFDCHEGSDENAELCGNRIGRGCSYYEIKCKNGKCVPKSKFCDHINDCGDLTDEPSECSCYTYLSATNPSKICDGVRNCYDKSDENFAICPCTANSFKCQNTTNCIPQDFVCDGEPDCPNSDDELHCYGLQDPINKTDGYAQVIERSFGVWHTKCFSREKPPSDAEITEICKEVGYKHSYKPTARIIADTNSTDKMRSTSTDKFETNPVKTEVLNKFTPLEIHPYLTIIMKPSRPMVKLVKWEQSDHDKCFRYEIKCD